MLENDVNLKFSGEKTKRDLPGCIASISWVVVSTAFGVAKLAKVKQFVRATGGARKAANVLMKIIKGGRSQENFQQFGKIVMDLSSEVLGIKDIKAYKKFKECCFSFFSSYIFYCILSTFIQNFCLPSHLV